MKNIKNIKLILVIVVAVIITAIITFAFTSQHYRKIYTEEYNKLNDEYEIVSYQKEKADEKLLKLQQSLEETTEITTTTVLTSETTTKKLEQVKMGNGLYKIGVEIPPGEYKLYADNSSKYAYPYYTLYADSNGNNVLSMDFFDNESYVTVNNGQYLKLNDCYLIVNK